VLKLELAIAVTALAGSALAIEQGHHVVIDAPVAAEAQPLPAAATCPENDSLPYDSRCLDFLNVPTEFSSRTRVVVINRDVPKVGRDGLTACPDSDKLPYSAECIAFLKGATDAGMRWRVTTEQTSGATP
jgi:hypothetical protein